MPSIVNYNVNLGNGRFLPSMLQDIERDLAAPHGKEIIVVTVQEADLLGVTAQLNGVCEEGCSYTLVEDPAAEYGTRTKLWASQTGMKTFIFVKNDLSQRVSVQSKTSFGVLTLSRLEHAASSINKGAIISTLTVDEQSINICNTHLDSYLPQQRLKEYQRILQACYGQPVKLGERTVKEKFDEIKQRLNVVLVGDFNTRRLVDGGSFEKPGMIESQDQELDVRQFNPMVGGLVATMPGEATYRVRDQEKKDKTRKGYRQGGILDGAVANKEIGVHIESQYAAAEPNKDKNNDHAGLKLDYALPQEDGVVSIKSKLLKIIENALHSYAYLQNLGVKNQDKTEANLQKLNDTVDFLDQNLNTPLDEKDIVVAFDLCVAKGGAIDKLMGEHIEFVKKRYYDGIKSNTYVYNNSQSREAWSSDDDSDETVNYSSGGETKTSDPKNTRIRHSSSDVVETKRSEPDNMSTDNSVQAECSMKKAESLAEILSQEPTQLLTIMLNKEPNKQSATCFTFFSSLLLKFKNWICGKKASNPSSLNTGESDDYNGPQF
jgi:endonuclease/exonuclease/phosphatase family metal-dependent hydrolase